MEAYNVLIHVCLLSLLSAQRAFESILTSMEKLVNVWLCETPSQRDLGELTCANACSSFLLCNYSNEIVVDYIPPILLDHIAIVCHLCVLLRLSSTCNDLVYLYLSYVILMNSLFMTFGMFNFLVFY